MALNRFLRSKRLATYDTPLLVFCSFVRAQSLLSSELLIALKATSDGWMFGLFVLCRMEIGKSVLFRRKGRLKRGRIWKLTLRKAFLSIKDSPQVWQVDM